MSRIIHGWFLVSSSVKWNFWPLRNFWPLIVVSYFVSQNKEKTFGNYFFDVCCINYRILPYYLHPQMSRSRTFSHIPRIKGNSPINCRPIDLSTGKDPVWSINHKILIFIGKCNESQIYCSKPKKSSSSEEGSSSISTVDRHTFAHY